MKEVKVKLLFSPLPDVYQLPIGQDHQSALIFELQRRVL